MEHISVSNARKDLYQLVDNVATTHEPALIKGKRNAVVMVAAEDWADIQETLFVSNNKSLAKSLHKGIKESYKECKAKLDW